jgi:GH24 family phage-related lysozyme (muramidase)
VSRASVVDGFVTFSGHFEGVVRTPYLDVLGLVTVAIGDLIDPLSAALAFPFVLRSTGAPATQDQISAAWHAVKSDPHAAHGGWRVAAANPGNTIELSDEGVQAVVSAKLASNEAALQHRFPDFEDWPADAQLATHSMAWACGPAFNFPALAKALLARDFDTAALQCHINTDGPDHLPNTADDNNGVKPRNVANVTLYKNAARVEAFKLDPETLHYPATFADYREELPDTQPAPPPPVPDDPESDRIIHPEIDLAALAQAPDSCKG